MKRLIPIILALLVIGISPFVSWSGELEDAKEDVRKYPNNSAAHYNLGWTYDELGRYKEAIASFKEAIRIKPDYASAHYNLGRSYGESGQHQKAIASYKEALRIKPDHVKAQYNLGWNYRKSGQYKEAIASYKEALRIGPDDADAHNGLGYTYEKMGRNDEAVAEYKKALRINPDYTLARNNLNELEQKLADERLAREQRLLKEERKKHKARQNIKEADRLAQERRLLEEERKKLEAAENRQRQRQAQVVEEQTPQSGSGSGFFVSKMGHVITNAHVVKGCNRVTVGDNANKQVSADIINTDRSNDLALLKLSSLEMTSAESKSLIQKLSIAVIPLASKGLLRSEDVRLGEKVLVAGFPFGDVFSNTIKVTSGIVSATRGPGDDSGQFQLDAAVQPGNSGGPIYDSSGNIVGVVISQLDKRKVEKAIGSLPENVNFGIKASTVRQFLVSSGLPSKKSERTEEKSTEQLAEIAKNQALMVMCF
jgi:S1-C subfamily serine protease